VQFSLAPDTEWAVGESKTKGTCGGSVAVSPE
jgi:hypothetical protein